MLFGNDEQRVIYATTGKRRSKADAASVGEYGNSEPSRAMARWSPLQESVGFLNLRSKRAHLRTNPKRGKNIRETG
jgi:hypothetical protein